jgi:hypothetical protein
MKDILHITSGDVAGGLLARAGLPGEVLVWHDVLYDGPRGPGWPGPEALEARAAFLEEMTSGGLARAEIMETLRRQYQALERAGGRERVVLWFDACLFDQSMLAHVLACLLEKGIPDVELLCVGGFPGVEPFHGLGQLQPGQLASLYPGRSRATPEQFDFARVVDGAFARKDIALLKELAARQAAPLPFVPAAAARWLEEAPDPESGLGRLERLALDAVRQGCETPEAIFAAVAARERPPQFWGDITLWAKLNGLADRRPPLVRIAGPAQRLPQWESPVLDKFTITMATGPHGPDASVARGSGRGHDK